jgi:hypothetical protein
MFLICGTSNLDELFENSKEGQALARGLLESEATTSVVAPSVTAWLLSNCRSRF